MSTNYYWMTDWPELPEMPHVFFPDGSGTTPRPPVWKREDGHIGKRSYVIDDDNGEATYQFTWARDPELVLETLISFEADGYQEKIVEAENGFQFSASEFLEYIRDCKVWKMHMVGKEFC